MSFLTKSNPSLAESMSRLGSRLEPRDQKNTKSSAIIRPREDVVSSLQSFRDDIRKQISNKAAQGTKFSDAPSPKTPSDNRTITSTKNLNIFSPQQSGIFNKDNDLAWSTKSFQKRADVPNEYLSRMERTSPKKSSPNKSLDLNSYISKRTSSQNSLRPNGITSVNRLSPKRRGESPSKSQYARTSLEMKPFNHFKKEGERKSFIDSQAKLFSTQSGFKEDIRNILEANKTPNLRRDLNDLRTEIDRPYSTTSQLRTNRTGMGSPTSLFGQESAIQKQHSADTLKNSSFLVSRYFEGSSGFKDNRTQKDEQRSSKKRGLELKSLNIVTPNSRPVQESTSPITLESVRKDKHNGSSDRIISDRLPVSKLYEVQDLFYNITDKEFDRLSSDYVEELIKLSSIIMHRVKNSSYYHKA